MRKKDADNRDLSSARQREEKEKHMAGRRGEGAVREPGDGEREASYEPVGKESPKSGSKM